MKPILLLACLVLAGCKSASVAPDASLFPDRSTEWRDGYQAGLIEGVLLTSDPYKQ